MQRTSLEGLVAIASAPLSISSPEVPSGLLSSAGPRGHDLFRLLQTRNGFYCFESALHVFPVRACAERVSLEKWNSEDLWKYEYGSLVPTGVFFAQDLFGCQFLMAETGICVFDPETAETKVIAGSVEEWATNLLADFEFLTGYPLAHEWQERNGPLKEGQRLIPKTPFVMGGAYELENLYVIDQVEAMRFRGNIARQIVNIPDGGTVRYTTVK